MGVFDLGYTQALLDASRSPIDRPPAGFTEAFLATFESVKQEDLTTSEALNIGRRRAERREVITDLTGEDISSLEGAAVPQMALAEEARTSSGRAAVKQYQSRLADLASRHPEIKTDEELLQDTVEESRRIREKTGKVLENTTFSGTIGSFAGAMAAAMTDPLILASMAFGASASAGILRTALTEAGVGSFSEAMIQPFVARYKKKLDSPFSFEEALFRVGAAGVGSGVFGGAIKGAIVSGRSLLRLRKPRIEGIDDLTEAFEANVKEPTLEQQDAANVLADHADVLRENPFPLDNPAAEMRHIEATAKAVADAENGRPVDVQEVVRGIEPRQEVRAPERVRIIKESAKPTPATENQSLGLFVKNSGGVAVNRSGDLRGEFDALFQSGGEKVGSGKKGCGKVG